MSENWKPVREFPDHYEVSTLGAVRRINAYRRHQEGRLLTPQRDKKGYVVFMLSVGNVPRLRYAHRLVADAFLGPIPKGMEVNHKNGRKDDPSVENLEIVSTSENRAHSYRVLGVEPNRGGVGLKNPHAKLSYAQVEEIRARYAGGNESYRTLAIEFQTTKQTIARIVLMKVRLAA